MSFNQQQTGYQPYGQSQLNGSFQRIPVQATGQLQNPQSLAPQATGYNFQMPPNYGQVSGTPTGMQNQQANYNGTQQRPVQTPKRSLIPNVRLSFITANDQLRFEELFKSAAKDEAAIDGDTARDILLRSNIPPSTLAKIWHLADTTKSGTLMFPEFALAMYLCNLVITGQTLPETVPSSIRNEVTSMMDRIVLNLANGLDSNAPPSNAPNFNIRPQPTTFQQPQPTGYQQPQPTGFQQPQPTGYQQPQPTGFQQPQPTGYQQPQQTGFQQPQPTGFQQPQPTGFQQPQPTGFQQPQPTGFQQSQPTGFQTNQRTGMQQGQGNSLSSISSLRPQTTGFQPASINGTPDSMQSQLGGSAQQRTPDYSSLNTLQSSQTLGGLQPQYTGISSQPTGRPGQWGFINTPASALPGIEALQSRMMPQSAGGNSFSTSGLQGNATIPWAVAKHEKRKYDEIFDAWDGLGKGFISGQTAIEIFSQSGLGREDLEAIWNLCDPSNRGKLDKDEFAVAMHLIYRKLNGYPIPSSLPPELVPPSSRNIAETVDRVKSYLRSDSDSFRVSSPLSSQATGVSYLKSHSFKGNAPGNYRKDATVFKNDDDDMYVSRVRHSVPKRNSAKNENIAEPENLSSLSDLRKAVRENQILLDAIDAEDENEDDTDLILERRDREDIDNFMRKIRQLQSEIDDLAVDTQQDNSKSISAERNNLRRQLYGSADKIPELTSKIRKVEEQIAQGKIELFRLRNGPKGVEEESLIGTGPNGEITEGDRRRARSKALLRARMAALTGEGNKGGETSADPNYEEKLAQESEKARADQRQNDQKIAAVEDSVRQIQDGLAPLLQESKDEVEHDRDYRRWEEGVGVADEVRKFIDELQRYRPQSRRHTDGRETNTSTQNRRNVPTRSAASPSPVPSSAETPAERQARIKTEAERRMNERLAALGISRKTEKSSSPFSSPSTPNPTAMPSEHTDVKETSPSKENAAFQRPATKDREEMRNEKPTPVLRDDEGIKGSQEEQALLDDKKRKEEELKAMQMQHEREVAEKAKLEEQRAQDALKAAEFEQLERKRKEQEERINEMRMAIEKQEAQMKALQEQALLEKQQQSQQQQQQQQQQQPPSPAVEKAQPSEQNHTETDYQPNQNATHASGQIDTFNERQDNDADDDDTASFKSAEEDAVSPSMAQSNESGTNDLTSKPEAGARNPFSSMVNGSVGSRESTNPFMRVGVNEPAKETKKADAKIKEEAPGMSADQAADQRARQRGYGDDSDDEWGASSSESDSDSDEDREKAGRNPTELASLLFSSMGPPPMRPSSANSPGPTRGGANEIPEATTGSGSVSEQAASSNQTTEPVHRPPPPPSAQPPPPPPMAPPMAPPLAPPPPVPSTVSSTENGSSTQESTDAGGPANLSGLLGQIRAGAHLKKASTNDRSQAASGGRVLN